GVAGGLAGAPGAHRLQGGDRPQAVLGLEEALHLAHALGKRAQQRRAVRDGLVARHLGLAGEPTHRLYAELHASFSRAAFTRASRAVSASPSPHATRRSRSSSATRKAATLAVTASRLARRISRQTSGSEAAMRVVSLKPRAATSKASGSKRATASTSAHATTCGRWLMAATARS